MKRIILALAATTALGAAAAPAMAQPYEYQGYTDRSYTDSAYSGRYGYDYGYGYQNFDRQFAQVARDIRSGQRDGSIEDWQAGRFWRQLQFIRQREAAFLRNDGQLNRWEQRDIQQRLQSLRYSIEQASNDYGDRDYWRR